LTAQEKRLWTDVGHNDLPLADQCRLLELPRSNYYYEPAEPSAYELVLMKRVDEIYTEWPFYGSRRIMQELRKERHQVNRKRVQGIMQRLGLVGNQPGPYTSRAHSDHHKFPYLLRDTENAGKERTMR